MSFYSQLGTATSDAVTGHSHKKARTAHRVVVTIHTRNAKTQFKARHVQVPVSSVHSERLSLTRLLWTASLLASLYKPLLSAIKEDLGLPSGYMTDIRADTREALIQYF
jgi:hypothetical protein